MEKKRSVARDKKKWIEKLMWAKQTSDARGPSKKREKEEKKRGGLMTTPLFFPAFVLRVHFIMSLQIWRATRKKNATNDETRKKARTPEERIVSRETRISASARARGRSRGRSRGRGTARARRRLCEIYIERERHARWLTWQQGKKTTF